MENIKKGITALVADELAHALLLHGMNNSHHESYAILKEEMEEANFDFSTANCILGGVWLDVKNNNLEEAHLADMRARLLSATAEMVQCIAMVDKWAMLFTDPRVVGTANAAESTN